MKLRAPHLALAATLCCCALLSGPPAAARGDAADATEADGAPDPRVLAVAQQYVKLGEQLFRLGEYEEAVGNFLKAEETLSEHDIEVPSLLYRSMARCYDQLGQAPAALSYYKKFRALAAAEGAEVGESLKHSDDAIDRLERQLGRTAARFELQPDGTEIRVDGRVVGRSPLADALRMSPGPHQVLLTAQGHVSEMLQLDLTAGATSQVIVTLRREGEPAPSAAATAPQPPADEAEEPPADESETSELRATVVEVPPARAAGPSRRSLVLPLALGGAALVAGLSAGLLAVAAARNETEGDDTLVGPFYDQAAAEQARDDAQDHYDRASLQRNVALGVGLGAVVAAGAATWLLLRPAGPAPVAAGGPPAESPAWALLPTLGLGGGGTGMTLAGSW